MIEFEISVDIGDRRHASDVISVLRRIDVEASERLFPSQPNLREESGATAERQHSSQLTERNLELLSRFESDLLCPAGGRCIALAVHQRDEVVTSGQRIDQAFPRPASDRGACGRSDRWRRSAVKVHRPADSVASLAPRLRESRRPVAAESESTRRHWERDAATRHDHSGVTAREDDQRRRLVSLGNGDSSIGIRGDSQHILQ